MARITPSRRHARFALVRTGARVGVTRKWQNRLRAECERSCRRKESAAGYSGGRSPGVVASADFAPRWSDHALER